MDLIFCIHNGVEEVEEDDCRVNTFAILNPAGGARCWMGIPGTDEDAVKDGLSKGGGLCREEPPKAESNELAGHNPGGEVVCEDVYKRSGLVWCLAGSSGI